MSRYRLVLRLVLEARSPISIASGETDPRYDVLLARDANSLPILPGTAVAGLLREVVASIADIATAETLFGRVKSGGEGRGTVASLVTVTGGVVHDSNDRPTDGLLLDPDTARLKDDALLAALLDVQPIKRDHVRISAEGVAADTAKFDRAAVPKGTRFTIQLELASDIRDDPRWMWVRRAVVDHGLRLGGGTRSGYGAIAVIRAKERCFDLEQLADLKALPLANRLDGKLTDTEVTLKAGASEKEALIQTTLIPKDAWRYGADGTPLRSTRAGEEPPHLVAVREAGVVWRASGSGDTGTLEAERHYVLPGSSIKGALRHRTMFHLSRLHGAFEDADKESTNRVESEVAALFGFVDEKKSYAGCLAVSDTTVDAKTAVIGTLWHNGIDRFSGGVRDGVLYGEELVFGGKLELCIQLTDRAAIGHLVRKALRLALEDLANGRLSLGAGAAKGHGVMTAPGMKSALAAAQAWFDGGIHA